MEDENKRKERKKVSFQEVEEIVSETIPPRKSRWLKCKELFDLVPKRIWIAVMCFLTMAVYYMVFSTFNILLVNMVVADAEKETANECGHPPSALKANGPRYPWNTIEQLQMICAFHVGQVFTTIPGGILAEKVGARYMVGGGMILAGVANLLIPTSASRGANSINMLRLLQGFSCGQIYPAMQCTFARWAPPAEKSKFVWTLFGSLLGIVFSFLLCNIGLKITKYWPTVFYIVGTISIVWAILWIYIVRDFPEKYPSISKQELQYIRKSIGPTVMPEFTMIQVGKVLSSRRYWALFAAQFSYYHGHLVITSLMPKYYTDVLGLPPGSFLRIVPSLTEYITGLMFCIIGDKLRRRKILSVTAIRKTFALISHFATGVFYIGNAYAYCAGNLAYVLQIFAAGCLGACVVTNLTNVHDLAPNHAGTVDGMIIFVPIITSITLRTVSGANFHKHTDQLSQWNIILSSTGYIYIAGGIIFSIWASGKIQIWNFPADFHFPEKGVPHTFRSPSSPRLRSITSPSERQLSILK